ncbi:hypothetical protein [Nocardioides ungokensis]|uniref:hypothetical protein n=1 Tax=Nocardioides ungokensis TaxID=1643322 RepID=UPI001FE44395|nr:hypothetical protein [Nocardioides ungokensis]
MTDPGARLDRERARTGERLARLRRDFLGVVDASRDSNADDEHDPRGRPSPSNGPRSTR